MRQVYPAVKLSIKFEHNYKFHTSTSNFKLLYGNFLNYETYQ